MGWTAIYNFGSGGGAGASLALSAVGGVKDATRWLTGSGDPAPSLGRDGDFYADTENRRVWRKATAYFGAPPAWSLVIDMAGAQGEQGEAGAAGPPGAQGPPGPAGATGATGATGAAGADGAPGAAGSQGDPGTPGVSTPGPKGQDANRWLTDDGVPAAHVGTEGDFYFDRLTGDVYHKRSRFFGEPPGWVLQASLTGPAGSDGPAGAVGERGPRGPKGDPGSLGLNLSVTGAANSVPTTEGATTLDVTWMYPNTAYTDVSNTFSNFRQNLNFSSVGETVVISKAFVFLQDADAALGAQQYSPSVILVGKGWATDSSSSMVSRWATVSSPEQGAAAPTGVISWWHQLGAGAWTRMADLDSTGLFTATAFAGDGSLLTNLPSTSSSTGGTSTPGPRGQDGSQILSGSGAPSRLLGVQGDFYFDESSGGVYKKERAFDLAVPSWRLLRNLTGATGAKGATGEMGPRGPQGPEPNLAGIFYREQLQANRTYYVRTDGNDANNGLTNTASGAFLTIQKAIDVSSALDNGGYNITIQVGNGTYTGSNTLKSFVGSGSITILGDAATPSNVLISVTSANCFTALSVTGAWILNGLQLATTTSGSGIVTAGSGCIVYVDHCDFAACVARHCECTYGSTISFSGNYSISGGSFRHWWVFGGGIIKASTSITCTLTGTPAWGTAGVQVTGLSFCNISNITYSGAATGKRHDVINNSILNAGAVTFPGSVAGTTGTGGLVI